MFSNYDVLARDIPVIGIWIKEESLTDKQVVSGYRTISREFM
jgi:hypothetical protein